MHFASYADGFLEKNGSWTGKNARVTMTQLFTSFSADTFLSTRAFSDVSLKFCSPNNNDAKKKEKEKKKVAESLGGCLLSSF